MLPYVLLTLMMGHKCLTDGLGRFTRVSGTPYSATGAAILGEVTKVPVLLLAILLFEGRERLGWILRESVRDAPFSLVLPGLAYSSQNILYFQALSHVSVATYQILSQSKLLFTAFFMVVLFNKRITGRQVFALVLLMVGSFMTQLSEMSRSAATGGNALYGCVLTLAGAVTSALPNVYYEKVLKDKASNQWVKNIQLTFWISVGLVLFGLPSMLGSLGSQGASSPGLWTGITPWVWALVWLQSLKCLLVPATLKYADNILYSYIKPVSIVLTAAVSAVVSGIVPTGSFVGGALLVMVSVWLYGA